MVRAACALGALFLVVRPVAAAGQSGAPLASPAPLSAAILTRIDGPPPPELPLISTRDERGRRTLRAVHLEAPLKVDGKLDEDLYRSVTPVSDFIQTEPTPDAPATEKTELWLSFDKDNFYLSFRVWESHPERMIVNEMRRDSVTILQNEHVAIMLDTFYTRRNSLQFMINANGGRMDGQTTNETQYNGDLNPIWSIAIGKFEGGWIAETAVPFKSLRYPPGREQIWGFTARRVSRWKNEIAYTSLMPRGSGLFGIMKASAGDTLVGIEAPSASRNLEIKPYVTADLTTDRTVSPPVSNARDAAFGVDLKYGIGRNLTSNLTYNTDFAQVEADEQQVNLTRFSLFFPEKRDFFLENAGTFVFGGAGGGGGGGGNLVGGGQGTGGSDVPTLFYSRRIGLEAGRRVPIRAGGRLTGRLGRFEIGAMDIESGRETVSRLLPTNFGVVRLKRDILRRSYIGAIATRRSGVPGRPSASQTYGVDSSFRFGNDLTTFAYWARTDTPGVTSHDTSYRGQLDYNADRYGVQVERLVIGDQFNPELGFIRRTSMRKSYGYLRFSPRPKASKIVRRYVSSGAVNYIENGAGRLETRQVDGDVAVEFQNTDRLSLGVSDHYEFLARPFRIAPGVTIPVGGYGFSTLRGGFNFGQQRRVFGSLAAERGAFYDGHSTTVGFRGARVSVTQLLYVEPNISFNWVDLKEGSFTTRLIGSRVTYTMTPQMFASALLQYNSTSNSLSSNVRLRWEYSPGSELFVVYNDGRDTLAPGFPSLVNRALIVKINRLLRF